MKEKQKVPLNDLDYVETYATALKKNNALFEQQKRLIESQLESNHDLTKKSFGRGEEFKNNVRKYLRSVGLI